MAIFGRSGVCLLVVAAVVGVAVNGLFLGLFGWWLYGLQLAMVPVSAYCYKKAELELELDPRIKLEISTMVLRRLAKKLTD